jgi:hypothetical protein
MRHYSRTGRTLCAALSLTLMFPLASTAQPRGPPRPSPTPDKELIAVLELEAAGTDRNLATALTDSLRESLLKTGRFTLVDRAQIDDILKEQAFQQTGCTTEECAVQVGKVLGVRKMVSGRVVKLDATHWRLSVSLLDVETAQTVRTESITHTGDFVSLVERATQPLAERLATPVPGERAPMVPPPAPVAQPAAPRPPEPPPQEAARTPEPSNPSWPWVTTGLASLALAAGAVTEAQAVTASNNTQKDLAARAKLATTQVQYNALLNQIADEKKKGQDAATLSNELAVGSVLLAAWAIYLAVRAPEKVAALRVVPVPDGTGGGRLLLVRTW